MNEETTACTPPDENPSTNSASRKLSKANYDYTTTLSRCVICGGRHDRRDKYGKCAICAQCLADLRYESLSRIAPAVMRDKTSGRVRTTNRVANHLDQTNREEE